MLGTYLLFGFIFILLIVLYVPIDKKIRLDMKKQETADIRFRKNITLDDEIFYIDYDIDDQNIDPNLETNALLSNEINVINDPSDITENMDIMITPETIEGFADYNNMKLNVGSPSSIQRDPQYRDNKTKKYVNAQNKNIHTIENMDMRDSFVRDALERKYYEMKRYEYNITNLENKYG
jgi:hypothetical protein